MAEGWLTDPVLIDGPNGLLRLSDGSVNIACRFAAAPMDKVRARGVLKYGHVNLACATRTPITLPTWGHIGQLFLDLRHADRDWEFFKAGHQDSYKNLPINPDQAPLCIVALRFPTDGEWCGFFPLTLLFGAAAAVMRYNCFSRIIAVISCSFFRLPALNYFDDLGCTLPDSISTPGQKVCPTFCWLVGFLLNGRKPKMGRHVVSLGLEGNIPGRDDGMCLPTALPESNKAIWPQRISDFIAAGWIPHKDLESLTGRLSFPQTSIFWRFGRGAMQPNTGSRTRTVTTESSPRQIFPSYNAARDSAGRPASGGFRTRLLSA